MYDLFDLNYDLYRRKKRKGWSKYVRSSSKALRKVKAITDNPIARAVIGVIPFGGTALTALDTATPILNAVDKKGAVGILQNPLTRAALKQVDGGNALMTLAAGAIGVQDEKEREVKVKRAKKLSATRILTQKVETEMQKREFQPGRRNIPMTQELAALGIVADLDEYDEDEEAVEFDYCPTT